MVRDLFTARVFKAKTVCSLAERHFAYDGSRCRKQWLGGGNLALSQKFSHTHLEHLRLINSGADEMTCEDLRGVSSRPPRPPPPAPTSHVESKRFIGIRIIGDSHGWPLSERRCRVGCFDSPCAFDRNLPSPGAGIARAWRHHRPAFVRRIALALTHGGPTIALKSALTGASSAARTRSWARDRGDSRARG